MNDFMDLPLDAIFDHLYDQVIVLDRHFRILKANRAYSETFGVPLDQLVGRFCFEVAAGQSRPCVDPEQECPLNRLFATQKAITAEHTYTDGAGNPVLVEIRAIPLIDRQGRAEQAVVILRNVTHWKRTENKLVDAFLQVQKIAEMGADAILVLNGDLQVEFANTRAASLTGYSSKELIHFDFRQLLDEPAKPLPVPTEETGDAGADQRSRDELRIRTARGVSVDCEVYFSSAKTTDGQMRFYVYLRDLSNQRLMDRKLRQSNEFLSSLIDSSVDGIIAADMKGICMTFNKGAEKLLGYKAEEVIGRFNIKNFYPPGVAQEIMRKLRSDDFGGKGKVLPHRITGIHKNGEHIPVSLSGALIYQDGKEAASVGIFYDLRALLKTQRELLESETNFRNLFERVRHGIYFSTRDGKFIDCNSSMLKILGYEDKEEFLSMEIARDLYVDPEGRRRFQAMIEAEGFVKDYEVEFKKKDGSAVSVLLTAHVRKDHEGTILGYQGIVIDVTERRKLEKQLFQSEKLAAMGRLTAQIAHELNNPLYGVMNCLDLIKSEIPAESKKRKFWDMAYNETMRISQLLKSMLKFFRPDEDVKSWIDLNQLVDDVVLFVGKQLQEFKIKVNLSLDERLPRIFASGNQMKQVALNMIMNAKNAMPGGGALTLSTASHQGQVQLRIADTGVGIPPENRDRIFEAFFTTKSDVKGVGLGLSVCFGIVREHGGAIEVESEVGRGTTFIITLPIGA